MIVTDRLRRLFYIRYPALCLLGLLLLGPVASGTSAKELLANTLLVHTFWQVLALTIICLTASKLFLVQAGVILFNAPARFAELVPASTTQPVAPTEAHGVRIRWSWSLLKTLLWLAAGLTLPLTAVWYSMRSQAPLNELGKFTNTVSWIEGLSGVVAGAFVDLCLLLLVAFVERLLVAASVTIPQLLPIQVDFRSKPDRRPWMIDRLLAGVLASPGYTDPPDEDGFIYFRPGHWQQIVVLGFVIAAYFVLWRITAGSTARPTPPLLPTLFFAILALTLVSTILAGTSFYLDYYRIPVLVVLALGVFLSYQLPARDHYFATPPRMPGGIGSPKLVDVVGSKDRELPLDKSGKRTLVIVTAPGGGIHAAAWTAQVLTGLHYRYGDEYARSLCLISAVSGGSVGTMYYAANFNVLQDPAKAGNLLANCEAIVERAGGSGLEAVGWGLVFRDLPAALSIVEIAGDRGTTLDECWQARLLLPDQNGPSRLLLGDWREPTLHGRMPIVVFNSTEVESGRRVLFSPVFSERRESLKGVPDVEAAPVEFTRTYPDQDVQIATAARLSATFPYVSPAATPKHLVQMGHLVDGGYADNEGIETAVDWISKLIDQIAKKNADVSPFDRVLILRIRHQIPADPLDEPDPDGEKKRHAREGFQFAAFGPLKAVLTVRGASQVERGQVEVDFLRDVPSKIKGPNQGISIESLFLDFKFTRKDQPPPLSWKLSPQEFVKYKKAWNDLKDDEVMQDIDNRYFKVIYP
jgi:hypothetical protein